jgi:hypothetical protein
MIARVYCDRYQVMKVMQTLERGLGLTPVC